MPIYEYECGVCGCRFERRQGFSDAPGAKCPQCQGKARRVLQSAPVIFKGSGFYVTDNPRSRSGESSRSTDKKESANGKGDSGKEVRAEKPATTEVKSSDMAHASSR